MADAHCDPVLVCRGFRLDLRFVASQQDQQPSSGTRMLDRFHHQRLDQLFEKDLAGQRLRHIDHRGEIQVLDWRSDGGRGSRRPLDPRMALVQLCDLAECPPAEVTAARAAEIVLGYRVEAARRVEPRSELVGHGLVLDEIVRVRQPDGIFVQALGVQLPAFEARDLRGDQRHTVREILGAVLCPDDEPLVMD